VVAVAKVIKTGHASPDDTGIEVARERKSIQSIERAFAILEETVSRPDGVGLAEISKRIGLHTSTVFHLVKTMVALGYIQQLKDSKRYRIGKGIFSLAAGAVDEIRLVGLATPILENLTRGTAESAHFAIRSGNEIVVLAKTAGTGMFQMADKVGMVRPAHCTALGKVLMAGVEPAELEQFLNARDLVRFTSKTIVEREILLQEIEKVRISGISYDDGEFDAEARCVAAPVHDAMGQIAGAIGISGPIWRLSIQALQEKAQQVRIAARDLSRELGFTNESASAAGDEKG
jgi:DNA-binding IclR family transcriptional regulator